MFLVNVEKCLRIFDKVYVSSDDLRILNLARRAGATPIKRGKELCGNVPDIPVYQHAIKSMDCQGIVAVHSDTPTINPNLIVLTKKLIEIGIPEVMTCHPIIRATNYKDQYVRIYGSIRGMTKNRLENYGNPYEPNPCVWITDRSIEIETLETYKIALKQ